MDKFNKNQIESAIEKLQKPDKVGLVGTTLGTLGGVGGGMAAASALGTTTYLALGGIAITAAAPVALLVVAGALGGAAGFGISKLARSGGRQDLVRKQLVRRLEKRLDQVQGSNYGQLGMSDLKSKLKKAVLNGSVTDQQAERIVTLVETGKLQLKVILTRLDKLADVSDKEGSI